MVSQIMEKMIAFSDGNIHDIDHLIRVWTYAKTIGELEGLDAQTQLVLEVAAITHDIACPLCREKYGSTNGKYFFISFGTIWRNNSRDKYVERQVKTDVHSPAEARVNRALGSMPHFYEAFVVEPENKMYIAPEERAAIW